MFCAIWTHRMQHNEHGLHFQGRFVNISLSFILSLFAFLSLCSASPINILYPSLLYSQKMENGIVSLYLNIHINKNGQSIATVVNEQWLLLFVDGGGVAFSRLTWAESKCIRYQCDFDIFITISIIFLSLYITFHTNGIVLIVSIFQRTPHTSVHAIIVYCALNGSVYNFHFLFLFRS